MWVSAGPDIEGAPRITDAEAGPPRPDPRSHVAGPLAPVSETAREPGLGLAQVIDRVMNGYADRPALAERRTELVTDPATGRRSLRLLPEFGYVSYRDLWSRAGALAADWASTGIRPGDFIAAIGFTSAGYAALDLAVVRLGAVAVSLQAGSALPPLRDITAETGPRVLAATPEYLDKAVRLALETPSRPRVLVFDHHPDADTEREAYQDAARRLAGAGLEISTFDEAVARGRTHRAPLYEPGPDEDPLAMLLYTSGSTGTPKGAMYPQSSLLRYWRGGGLAAVDPRSPACMVNYMPMSHMYSRVTLAATLARGGVVHYTARSDLSTLLDDFALARPTELFAVPRVFDMLHQEYKAQLSRRAGEFADDAELDAAVKEDLRTRVLGGRLLMAMVGSAPMAPEMRAFARSCLGVPLQECYGSTEAGIVVTDGRVTRPLVTDYRLIDVPELGYHTSDRPHPRGELLLKTEGLFPGYYRRPEITASVIDADGYYRTGDIMAETGPDQLAYVDRRNNVQKLSQGEFVTLSKVESVLTANPLVRQIYVYGDSARAYLLAVLVPTEQALEQAGGPEALKPRLAESLRRTAEEAGLEPYEIPRDFLVETEPFSTANGLLSDIRKPIRPRLRERYQEPLDQLYDTLARRRSEELRALRDAGRDQAVRPALTRALSALLGTAPADIDPAARFTDLGGDSLAALSFSKLLEEIFHVEVPVSVVTGPAYDLAGLGRYIEARSAAGAERPTFARVHGPGATEIRAADLRLDAFLDARTRAAARRLPAPAPGHPGTVLLTGATGYLGRFLCLDWLERLAPRGGKLICLVRGADDAAARARLERVFDTGDPELPAHFRKLADGHLEVFAADLGEARCGLDETTWLRLCDEADTVCHPGALVNHVLPYDQLFGPNVAGTAELIRLALTRRIKPFINVSTVGVGDQAAPGAFTEEADIRRISPVRRCGDGYANGYALSKWAGEVLLREAHEHFGLPVSVFRSGMILTHRRHPGQLNVPDMFTRLLLSLVTTGIAPGSFYTGGSGDHRPRAHHDGLPADFSAEAVNVLGALHPHDDGGYRTYHLLNPHDDGISLDTFVDWLTDAGCTVRRIPGYDEWLRRFRTALRGLPETVRRRTVLPLLHSYERPASPTRSGTAPAPRFEKAVRKAGLGTEGNIPHLTPELIVKYLTDLRMLGLLPST
ncbi:carboxylic acid reductase [Streptomyces sp. BBFR2]|uniref:carboxylic acid reductase n=1 Tax=Streptomyces sp. BBFR2 TaxID=3372854 RepID=UPI0037D9B71E